MPCISQLVYELNILDNNKTLVTSLTAPNRLAKCHLLRRDAAKCHNNLRH